MSEVTMTDAARRFADLLDSVEHDGERHTIIRHGDDVAIAAITVAEFQVGARLATGRRRSQRQRFVDVVCDVIPILSYDRSVAAEHAELLVAVRQAGRPRDAHHLIIAATARASKRTVVTISQRSTICRG